MNNRRRGDDGEIIAVQYLKKQGHTILARNHCVRGGEIDIIFLDGSTVVFCEVKLRTQSKFGTGAEAVDERKRRCICRAALDYAYTGGYLDSAMRFDIIEITGGRIAHIKGAFEFIEP
ncbi:MAG: YraN family protein [Christensenellales bacterium]